VVYGHPAFGDERALLHFAASGAARLARQDDETVLSWNTLAGWSAKGDEMRFNDPQTGRQFEADLGRPTLGGSWRTLTLAGGWWCKAIDTAEVPVRDAQQQAPMPRLVPSLTATPRYPVQAIRAAKQGRAVTCFFVDADGYIVQPEVIELSDEVFRAPSLAALERSRYRGWEGGEVLRPGCRSYTFRLDAPLPTP
jgi:hypothetical protein